MEVRQLAFHYIESSKPHTGFSSLAEYEKFETRPGIEDLSRLHDPTTSAAARHDDMIYLNQTITDVPNTTSRHPACRLGLTLRPGITQMLDLPSTHVDNLGINTVRSARYTVDFNNRVMAEVLLSGLPLLGFSFRRYGTLTPFVTLQ